MRMVKFIKGGQKMSVKDPKKIKNFRALAELPQTTVFELESREVDEK